MLVPDIVTLQDHRSRSLVTVRDPRAIADTV